MPSINNNHRIDQVRKVTKPNHIYVVPAGMGTIKYLSKSRAKRSDILNLLSDLDSGYVLLISYYDGAKFVITCILDSIHDSSLI